jgi:metal-responsive CopG/Arc/MetJ family transcriptional regulator
MKVKTSITLSIDVLRRVEQLAGPNGNRSAFIEAALLLYISECERKERDQKDLKILNARARRLNQEAEDTLSYQYER